MKNKNVSFWRVVRIAYIFTSSLSSSLFCITTSPPQLEFSSNSSLQISQFRNIIRKQSPWYKRAWQAVTNPVKKHKGKIITLSALLGYAFSKIVWNEFHSGTQNYDNGYHHRDYGSSQHRPRRPPQLPEKKQKSNHNLEKYSEEDLKKLIPHATALDEIPDEITHPEPDDNTFITLNDACNGFSFINTHFINYSELLKSATSHWKNKNIQVTNLCKVDYPVTYVTSALYLAGICDKIIQEHPDDFESYLENLAFTLMHGEITDERLSQIKTCLEKDFWLFIECHNYYHITGESLSFISPQTQNINHNGPYIKKIMENFDDYREHADLYLLAAYFILNPDLNIKQYDDLLEKFENSSIEREWLNIELRNISYNDDFNITEFVLTDALDSLEPGTLCQFCRRKPKNYRAPEQTFLFFKDNAWHDIPNESFYVNEDNTKILRVKAPPKKYNRTGTSKPETDIFFTFKSHLILRFIREKREIVRETEHPGVLAISLLKERNNEE